MRARCSPRSPRRSCSPRAASDEPAPPPAPVAPPAPARRSTCSPPPTCATPSRSKSMVEKATGVPLKFPFGGTMESTEAVLTGSDEGRRRLVRQRQVPAVRPAGPGAREAAGKDHAVADRGGREPVSQAKTLGWDDPAVAAKVTWKTITAGGARRQAELRAVEPGHLQPGLHGADGRGGGGEPARPRR